MKRLNLILSTFLILGIAFAVSCGGGAAPAPAVTVTATAKPGPASTVTVTQTAAPVTVTTTPTPTPTKLVKVTDAQPTGGTMLFFMAVGKEQGFFEKRGIDLTPLEMAADAAKVAPFLGQADIGGIDPLSLYPERKDLRVIGPHFNAHISVLVRKDSPYRSYQDLKGKKIGTMGPATGQYQIAKVVTKLEGLDLEKDFQLIIGAAAVQIGWLLKGEVEAIHIFEPLTSKLLVSDGDKVRELYWLNDLYKKHSGANWTLGLAYTSDAWVKKNPDLAKQAGLAYDDAYRYIYGHDQVWKSDLAKNFWKIDDPNVLNLLAQRMPGVAEFPPYGPAYKAAQVKKAQLVADAGLVPKEAVEWLKGVILFAEP